MQPFLHPKPDHQALEAPKSLAEQIAEETGRAIVAGEYPPEHRLVETDVASAFGVSRGPVREALRILERRRLIDLIPRRGAYVRTFSLQSVRDLFDVRIALACLSVKSINDPQNSYIDTFERRVNELRAMAPRRDSAPSEFAHIATRAVSALVHAGGNALAAELMTELAKQTVWTTMWRHHLDFLTASRRTEVSQILTEVLASLRRGRFAQAEKGIREFLETDRDSAVAELTRLREGLPALKSA